ncbi:septal ring lytic transglycosylase RlpA family protein [Noviherbaspirillum aridicola]|uniref:Endolytic peptidoglycan transglycosylase RlpA n=1 Tax=Noviherbaspirillum aridicola TaxID=2849687 RepID=A0ABQ4Q0K8_9BURK|nr:septal ring lytic transglycosylase RlpA family protein [Noviherbaspirillum aridicola]GIZ50703.1 lipoprotein [Noviherbaspirillum aridicola]
MRIRFQACHRHLNTSLLLLPLILAGCSSVPLNEPAPVATAPAVGKKPSNLPALPPAGSGRGGYYKDDGPGDNPPDGLLDTPDAEPRVEPPLARANRPYVVFGKTYTPMPDGRPYKQRGIGSWYGKKFHGQKTSSGELYDMYKMTAAHPTLPIPSYVRVTHLVNGKQVIVRVNDRGPFHSGRIIDLSYTAALKLGYLGKGSGELEVELLLPDEIARINAGRTQLASRAEAPQQAEVMAVSLAGADAGIETRPLPPPEILPAVVQQSAPAVVPMPAGAAGYYVQLGAFSRQANAEAERGRLQQNQAAGPQAIEVVQAGGLYRLHSGPFASREEAAAAATRLQSASGARPVIVQR